MFAGVRNRVVSCTAGLIFAALPFSFPPSSFAQPADSSAGAQAVDLPALDLPTTDAPILDTLIADTPISGSSVSTEILPDAPIPQEMVAEAVVPEVSAAGQPGQTEPGAQTGSGQSGSGESSSNATAAEDQETKHAEAEEQLKQQEQQRVLGVMASFNTTRNKDALPLSSGQKFQLFFKSSTDPWPFGLAAVVAGIGQADDSYPAWGQGMGGYATRFGGAYADYFIGNFFGNAVLPSLWHEDPRYFQKGSGRAINRVLWAAASTVWCKRDNGTWGPNYANVTGNLVGAAIARTYYPANERTVSDTVTDGLTVSAEGIVGAEVIEFWPDMVRHHRRKQAEKQAALDAAKEQKQAAKPEDQNHQ